MSPMMWIMFPFLVLIMLVMFFSFLVTMGAMDANDMYLEESMSKEMEW